MDQPTIDIRAFRRSLRALERQIERALASETECCGVTPAQCHLLLAVEEKGEPSVGELAAALELDQSTLSRTVDGLVRAGMLNRREDPSNRRRQLVGLTDPGRAKADAINALCDESYSGLLASLPGDEALAVIRSLPLFAEALRAWRGSRSGKGCCGPARKNEADLAAAEAAPARAGRAPVDLSAFSGSLPPTEGCANLSPSEARELCGRGAAIVDLREAYETNYRVFDVPNVIYLPWSAFNSRYSELPRGEALILADASGIYDREAARILIGAGYANVAKLSGGMIDWDSSGQPVRRDAEYELGGQCACKIKTRHGGNPLIDKGAAAATGGSK